MIAGGVNANTNYHGQPLATRSSSTATDIRRSLLKFDTSTLAPNASIARATLRLTVQSAGSTPFRPVGAYWVKRSFVDAQATWKRYRIGLPWTTPGGDFGPRYAIGEVANAPGARANFDVTMLVQDAVNNKYGTRWTRVGLLDLGPNAGSAGADGFRRYYPASAAAAANRPQLLIVTGKRSPIRTVFLIVMENTNWAAVKGSGRAPYINKTLLPMASRAERYYNPPGLHPSLPNYLWIEAGRAFGIRNDAAPATNHQSTTQHLVRLLSDAGISWKSYQEDIPGNRCPLTNTAQYVPRHNPMVYFDDVTGRNNPASPACIAHVRPYGELAADLRNNRVARYNFITPNLCHDMHDCGIEAGDMWLSTEIPRIMESQAYKNGGAIFLTWDEGAGTSDGPIGMIVLSPFAKGRGYANTIRYTHSSLLRTLEEIFAVTPLLGDAARATSLRDLFR
jgi:hypothetical protein